VEYGETKEQHHYADAGQYEHRRRVPRLDAGNIRIGRGVVHIDLCALVIAVCDDSFVEVDAATLFAFHLDKRGRARDLALASPANSADVIPRVGGFAER
jgi:hypothetical protein